MNLFSVESTFDASRLTFFFTADGRVDFRQLVKILVKQFRVRIEMRQVGIRNQAKMCGGLGRCGRRVLLFIIHGKIRAGIDPHGQTAGTVAQPDQNLGPVRPVDVLPDL